VGPTVETVVFFRVSLPGQRTGTAAASAPSERRWEGEAPAEPLPGTALSGSSGSAGASPSRDASIPAWPHPSRHSQRQPQDAEEASGVGLTGWPRPCSEGPGGRATRGSQNGPGVSKTSCSSVAQTFKATSGPPRRLAPNRHKPVGFHWKSRLNGGSLISSPSG